MKLTQDEADEVLKQAAIRKISDKIMFGQNVVDPIALAHYLYDLQMEMQVPAFPLQRIMAIEQKLRESENDKTLSELAALNNMRPLTITNLSKKK